MAEDGCSRNRALLIADFKDECSGIVSCVDGVCSCEIEDGCSGTMELRRWRRLRGLKVDIFVRELAGGVLSNKAVLHGGLWPPTPPLCRCAEYTACQLLCTWWAIYRLLAYLLAYLPYPLR